MADGRGLLVAIDANALDRDGSTRDRLVESFEAQLAAGHLRLFIPAGVVEELRRAPPGVQARTEAVAALAEARLRAAAPTARQHIDRIRVRAMLRGDGRPGKHDADASHLSEAAEAGCDLFLTRDGKILRKRDILRAALPAQLRIATLEEFMSRWS
jgi:rRNA-processing protein FCF1